MTASAAAGAVVGFGDIIHKKILPRFLKGLAGRILRHFAARCRSLPRVLPRRRRRVVILSPSVPWMGRGSLCRSNISLLIRHGFYTLTSSPRLSTRRDWCSGAAGPVTERRTRLICLQAMSNNAKYMIASSTGRLRLARILGTASALGFTEVGGGHQPPPVSISSTRRHHNKWGA